MQFVRQGDRLQFRFLSDEHFPGPLLDWLDREQIGFGVLTGLGAVSGATVSYWNAGVRQYEQHEIADQMEVVSLIGNVTIRDGKPFVHAHVGLSRRDLSMIGGHLNDLTVEGTLEVWLQSEAIAVRRELDESCGLYVMQLPEQA